MSLTKELSYGDFSLGIYEKTHTARFPSHGHFELTFGCPLKCSFCYCSPFAGAEFVRNELTTNEVLSILDDAAAEGCLWMTFSGGDPFLRPDFRRIYDHAVSKGMILTIFCSGLIMTEDWIARLKETLPLKIEMPLYGVTAATYEAVSGKPGSFLRAMKNIRRMLEAGLPVKLKTKITRENLAEVEAIRDFMSRELGLDFFPNFYLYPRLDGSRDHLVNRISPLQAKKLQDLFTIDSCDSGSEAQSADPTNTNLFRCAAGINSFYINPYGELNFCTYVREHSYDLKTGTIKDGVEKLRQALLTKTRKAGSPCTACSIQGSCNNCPGSAVLETGVMEGKSDYLCETNHVLRGKEWNA